MRTILFVAILSVFVWAIFGNVKSADAQEISVSDAEGISSIDQAALQEELAYPVNSVLSIEEEQGLIYLREEEKLAHDVYVSLYQTWGLNIFQNIANSEATHTAAIKTLLDRYGISDPVGSNPVGVFTNPDLQALYTRLVADGSKSLVDALKVGAAIEELDIKDLQTHLAETDNLEIELVYENLMRGSQNHLRAFTSTLERQTGVSSQPQQGTYGRTPCFIQRTRALGKVKNSNF